MGSLLQQLQTVILYGMTDNITMEALLNQLRDRFGCDIIVYDRSYNVKYGAIHETSEGAVRSIVQEGRLTDDERGSFEEDLRELVASRNRAGIFSVRYSTFTLAKIIRENSLEGILCCVFNVGAAEDDMLAFSILLADTLTFMDMGTQEPQVEEDDYIEDIIARELLVYDDNTGDGISDILRGESDRYGTPGKLSPNYAVVIIKSRRSDNDMLLTENVYKDFRRTFPGAYALIRHEKILAFFTGLAKGSNRRYMEPLEQFISGYNVCASVSSLFNRLEDRKYYRRQASDTLTLAFDRISAGGVLYSEECYASLMLRPAVYRYGKALFILSEIRLLKAYDDNGGSKYTETLWQYLKCGRKAGRAAAALYIDRSTLNYRLKRITEITGHSPDDPAYARQLMISLAVLFMA